jgi:hypothetical protein
MPDNDPQHDRHQDRARMASKALEMRQKGATFEAIAAELNVSPSKAARLYRRALDRVKQQTLSSVEVLVTAEGENLRQLERMVHCRLGDDVSTPVLFAGIKLLLDVSARRSKLHGLDAQPAAPFKPAIDPSQPGGPITDQQRVKRIMELLGGTKPAG